MIKEEMQFLEEQPQTTYMVRMTDAELDIMKDFALKNYLSLNKSFRLVINNLKSTMETS
tara:strand:+ start:208 stop:384 length:177 start_codon:yes stop_codon:yes gene_type:complete